jgi:purine-nucleoside phosphorylase
MLEGYFSYVRTLGKLPAKGTLLSELEVLAAKQCIQIPRVCVASTGALYRETPHVITEFTSRGADCIDMEVSGLYATVATKKDAQAAALLYVSDLVSYKQSNKVKLDNRYGVWETTPKRNGRISDAELLAGKLCLNLCGMHLAI